MPQPARRELRWVSPQGFLSANVWEWLPAQPDPSAPPVLCVHGLTRNGRDFDVLARALAARGRRVLCPDLPGRGLSEPLRAPIHYQPQTYTTMLVTLLAWEKEVDWVGTSLGGILGMLVGVLAGNPIRRLVLNDIGPFVSAAAAGKIRDYVGKRTAFADMAECEAYLREVHAGFGALTDAQWAALAASSARPAEGGGVELTYDPRIAVPLNAGPASDADLWQLWPALRQSMLVLRGETSEVLLPSVAARMAEAAHVRVETIAGCGHAPALMDDAQVGLVAGFLG